VQERRSVGVDSEGRREGVDVQLEVQERRKSGCHAGPTNQPHQSSSLGKRILEHSHYGRPSPFAFPALPPHTTFALQFALDLPTAFVMPSIRFLTSLPNEDGLYAALKKMEATEAASITILQKRSQYEPLRNIISGLWFAILYRAVERHTSCDKEMRKVSRCRAVRNLTACLRAGKEIAGHNNNISKMVSKRVRSGLAS
jgi:hypothetical protein